MTWLKVDDGYGINPKVRRASPGARLVHLMSMIYCAQAENDGLFPAGDLDIIAAWAGCKNVQDVATELTQIGLWHESNGSYSVHDFLEYNPTRAKLDATRAREKARIHSVRANKTTTHCQQTDGVGETLASPVPIPIPIPIPDPVPSPKRSRSIAARSIETEGFVKFYTAYPRKVGRPAAAKAWPGDDLLQTILSALEWQRKQWTDPQYIPYPATYLRNRRWEDEKQTDIVRRLDGRTDRHAPVYYPPLSEK